MEPTLNNGSVPENREPRTAEPLDTPLAPPDSISDEQQKLWEAYREQQRRRSCPGCGDDGLNF